MDWVTTSLFTLVLAIVFGYCVQRMLGVRLGIIRLLLGGAVAVAVTVPILRGMVANVGLDGYDNRLWWFLLLSALAVLFASMLFLMVAEAFVPFGRVPPAREWGRGLRGRVRRSRRYFQIVRIVVRRGLWPYLRGGRRRALTTVEGRAEFGRRLAAALDDAGVTFVKLGQLLATRRDLVPAEIADRLAVLQDHASPVPWPEVEQVIVRSWGAPVAEFVATVEHEPLAAASVGQVHAATLHDGSRVVLKVCRPGVATTVEQDLDIAFRFAARLEVWTGWAASVGASRLAEGMATALREELDFRVEAANLVSVAGAETARRTPTVVVPAVVPHLCGRSVLVMQRLDGRRLADADAGVDRSALARTVLRFLVGQVMVDGLFHADPHPGNILLLDDGRIGLLDLGSVGRLDRMLRETLQRLLRGVDGADPLAVSDALLELVPRPEDIDTEALERDLGRFLARYVVGGAASGAGGAQMFGQLFRVVAAHRLAVPAEIAAVFRALGTVEGTLVDLDPAFDLIAETRSAAAGLASERLEPSSLKDAALEEIVALAPLLRRLPRRVERIVAAAEHGRFTMSVRPLADERDRAFISSIVHQVLLALIAATTGIMSVVLLSVDGGPMVTPAIGLFELIGYFLLLLAAILGLRVLAPIFRRDVG